MPVRWIVFPGIHAYSSSSSRLAKDLSTRFSILRFAKKAFVAKKSSSIRGLNQVRWTVYPSSSYRPAKSHDMHETPYGHTHVAHCHNVTGLVIRDKNSSEAQAQPQSA